MNILFLIYNRPELTARVFEVIRQAQPKRLFIAGDGAKNEADQIKVGQARQIVDKVDWECEVHTLFRQENLGCGKAVVEAITWFFRQVEYGIILEDDCLVDSTFFRFCEEMLVRCADNEQIMLISAMSFLTSPLPQKREAFPLTSLQKTRNNTSFGGGGLSEHYYFSQFAQIWGWASWRRAWAKLDFDMKGFDSFVQTNQIQRIAPLSKEEQKFWVQYLKDYKERNPNLWATRWWFSVWQARGLSVTPYNNLVSNIGFGENSTNTAHSQSWYANLPTQPLSYPLQHPNLIEPNYQADHLTYRIFFNPREKTIITLKNWLSQYLPVSLRRILKKIFWKPER
jgi:hypothetical protein